MRVAETLGCRIGRQIIHGLIGHHSGGHIKERHIEMLPFPSRITLPDRGQYRRGGIETRENIRDGNTDLLRLTIWFACHRHQTRHTLDDVVVPSPMCVRPVLAKTSDRTINQSGIFGY